MKAIACARIHRSAAQSLLLACTTLKTVVMFYMPIVPSAVHCHAPISLQSNTPFSDKVFYSNVTKRLLAQFKPGTAAALF